MELKLPTPEQLETVYDAHLKVSFPAAELKPLRIIRRMLEDGYYRPWCLMTDRRSWGSAFCGWETRAGRCWIICAFPPAAAMGAWGRC